MIANPKNQQTPESQSLASIAFGISLEESLYPSHETLHEFLDQAPAPPPAIIINSSLLDPRNLLHGDERRPLNFPCKSIYTQGSSHGLVTRLTNSLSPPPLPSSYGNVPWTFDSPPRPFPVYSPVSRYVMTKSGEGQWKWGWLARVQRGRVRKFQGESRRGVHACGDIWEEEEFLEGNRVELWCDCIVVRKG